MRFLNTILDIIFPPKCLVCGREGIDLCLSCIKDAPVAERESENWIFPLYDYRHPPIKKALWLLKYNGKRKLANIFAKIIYEKIMEELSELGMLENFTRPILIPIPLSRGRYHERGFNQAELICQELIKIQNKNNLTPPASHSSPLQQSWRGAGGEIFTLETNILIKPQNTEHQAKIKNRSIRLKNVIGSFAIKNGKLNENINLIKGRNIILIDDILTTGATLNEARKVLKHAGVRKIIAFTVAH